MPPNADPAADDRLPSDVAAAIVVGSKGAMVTYLKHVFPSVIALSHQLRTVGCYKRQSLELDGCLVN